MRFTAVALTAIALLISQTAASPHPEPQGGPQAFTCNAYKVGSQRFSLLPASHRRSGWTLCPR
ncbi:hypothetical protein P691DRAFT_778969 [Macrolepiota fuliginosa MF-IS2]|uniref:Uncharacterized protein n=1 Tax=Macrolepiota fuliginosa MF-IS2 TaxID=1400762 RepID=A0A9P6BZ83_9AGAR|nr:hypothetical protein P691DRAFT_778969 [Macrolepiota fuliginosa MF-IS2]